MSKKIGLYFGSFNPIHVGHIIIANHLAEHTDLDQVWLVVSPHNPHKKKASLLEDFLRLEMAHLACKNYLKIKPCDIEFGLPQPSYTINTLAHLVEKHPKHHFSLIMGQDNLANFHKWKNYEHILENHSIYVYPRISSASTEQQIKHPNIIQVQAPIIEISSTYIRNSIKENKNVRPLLDQKVWNYIDKNLFYK